MAMNRTVKIPSRTEMVIERITEFIFSGQYSVGEILPPEKKLCEMFGISRSIMREAVKVLAAKGLLEVKQGSGTAAIHGECPLFCEKHLGQEKYWNH